MRLSTSPARRVVRKPGACCPLLTDHARLRFVACRSSPMISLRREALATSYRHVRELIRSSIPAPATAARLR